MNPTLASMWSQRIGAARMAKGLVQVIGVTDDGQTAFTRELEQGGDPLVLAFDLGYVLNRPLDAVRNVDGDIDLRLSVRPRTGQRRPRRSGRSQDPGLDLGSVTELEVRQRVAAYVLVTSERGLLATEFSNRTSVPGRWGLPGGGIDEDEQPCDAVLREVAEETRQVVQLGELVGVQTSHWVGRSPRNTLEDYHAVRLVYEATCDRPTEPVVVDVGGTTESARWVPLEHWSDVAWTTGWRQLLKDRLKR
jgi:8-oxo-dGTP pyrophosphatase MutT (NUDIX family)